MRIVRIKPYKKPGAINGDNFDINMTEKYRVVYPNDEPGKEKVQRRFAIRKLKTIAKI